MKKYVMIIFFLLLMFFMGASCASELNDTSHLENDDSNLVSFSSGTFTDLKNNITNSKNELNLTSDYKYDEQKDKNLYPGDGGKYIGIEKSIVINGNNHTIDADLKEKIGIFNLTGGNVTINDLTFKNILATSISSTSNLVLNNVKFINSGKADEAIITSSFNLTMNKCLMENISGSAIMNDAESLTINDTVFLNSKTNAEGFINFIADKLMLENCKFENITSEYGAAISFIGLDLIINNSIFNNLHANVTGGAIAIKGIPLKEEFKKYLPHETLVVIENSVFSNVSSEKNGGAIYADMGSASYTKGSIAGNVSISDSSFINCKSEFGGAILQLNGRLFIKNSDFTNNSASVSGGAVYTSYADMNIEKTEFNTNFASRYGGAIYVELNTTSIGNCSFISNKAEISSEFNPSTIYAYDTAMYIRDSFFNNSRQSVSSLFTKEFIEKNNTWNNDEFHTNLTLYPIAYNDAGLELNLTNNEITVSDLPVRFDLRDWGWVTPVKNQGTKGACWVFGTVAALESALLKSTGNIYDLSENNIQNSMLAYSRYGSNLIFEGGYLLNNLGYILSWMGVLPQEDDFYDQKGKISDILDSKNKIHIQNIGFIPIKRDENNLSYSQTNELIKKAVIEHGAVSLFYAGEDATYVYNNNSYTSNHVVALVGWDDNFPKEKFNSMPPANGAWIIKNSWGEKWGEKGYGYVSYYDTSVFAKQDDMELDYTIYFIIENTENYTYNYQTDFTGISGFIKDYTFYSNEFEAFEKADIAAVGTYFNDTGVDYEFKIYVNGNLKLSQNGTSDFAGFKTIKLNKVLPINENDTFKVVFKSNNLPYQDNSRQHLLDGMSYVSSDANTWIDYSTLNRTVCLKVYTLSPKNRIITEDLVKIYKNESGFVADIGQKNKTVNFEINCINYTRTSDENGIAVMAINLSPGNYTIKTTYNGCSVENNIEVLPTLIGENLIKYYRNESQFYISLVNGRGTPVCGVNITMNINGVFYNRTTNENGTAKLNINLGPGQYILTAADPLTGLMMSYNITVLPIILAQNISMHYKDGTQFRATLLDGQGNPLPNKNLTFNINGIFYTRTTDLDGVSSLNINLMAGEYIITSYYDSFATSNRITIKN